MADFSDLVAAAQAVVDPSTSAADLAAIAQTQPSLREHVANHPNVYPGLTDWLAAHGVVRQDPEPAPTTTPDAPVAPPAVSPAAPDQPVAPAIPEVQSAQQEAAPTIRTDGKMRLKPPRRSVLMLVAGILLLIVVPAAYFFVGWGFGEYIGDWQMAALVAGVFLVVGALVRDFTRGAVTGAAICLFAWGTGLMLRISYWWDSGLVVGLLAALMVAGGVLLLVAVHLAGRPQTMRVLRLVAVVVFGVSAVLQIWQGIAGARFDYASYLYWGYVEQDWWIRELFPILAWILVPIAFILVALSLAPDYALPVVKPVAASQPVQAMPLYTLATMPDGSQQMVPVVPTAVSAGPSKNRSPVAGIILIAAAVVVFAVCSIIQGQAGTSMFTQQFYPTGNSGLDTLVQLTWWPGWIATVGLLLSGIGALVRRK